MRALVFALPVVALVSHVAPAWCGDVAAVTDGSKLVLASGAGDESLTITGLDATSFQVTPNPPTTLDGSADPQVLRASIVAVDLGLGTNTLTVIGVTLVGALSVDGDVGNDSVTVTQCDLAAARFLLGGGDNGVLLADSVVGNKLVYRGQDGSDGVAVVRTPVDGNLDVNVGGGTNTVVVDTVQAGDLLVEAGGGSDKVDAVDVTLARRVRLDLGGGANDTDLTRLTAETSLLYVGGADTDWLDLTTVAFTNGKALVKMKGGDNSLVGNGVTIGKNLAFAAGFGEDTVSLADSTVTEGVALKVAGGPNEVSLQDASIGEGVAYRGGKDSDVFGIAGGTVTGPVVVDLGGADNFFERVGGTIGPLTVKGRKGFDGVLLMNAHVTGSAKLALSGGASTTTLDAAVIDGGFTLKTGAQDDTYSKLNGTTIAGKETVKLGGGTNTVTP